MGRPAINPRPPMPIVQEISTAIADRQLTHEWIAKRAGVSNQTISRWRTGRNSPSLFEFECVAQVLGYRVVLVPMEPAE